MYAKVIVLFHQPKKKGQYKCEHIVINGIYYKVKEPLVIKTSLTYLNKSNIYPCISDWSIYEKKIIKREKLLLNCKGLV